MNADSWTKVAALNGYDGIGYLWGNYIAVSTSAGKYRLQWHLLRRQSDGRYEPVNGCRPLTQTFAIRPFDQSAVEAALDWAQNQIAKYRARRTLDESGPYRF